MINKIYKRIHNKYSSIFKFFFFLRHVFIIFLISTALFFSVPKFFDYEKKQQVIKKYLIDFYSLELNNYNNIEFNKKTILITGGAGFIGSNLVFYFQEN